MWGYMCVNIGRLTALHKGVRPLFAQVRFTYPICAPPVCHVGVKDATLTKLPKSIIMQILSFDFRIQWLPGCLFYPSESGPGLSVWQPVAYCFSVPPANKL